MTGGSGSIGSALVNVLISLNCRVTVLDSSPFSTDHLDSTFINSLICDLTNDNSVTTNINSSIKRFGPLDGLINCVGLMRSCMLVNPILSGENRHSLTDWQQIIDVNLTSVFIVSRTVVQSMLNNRTKGVIVNVSSICSSGNPGQSAYSASKAGVEALTSVWSKELSPFGIRCACIAPGFVDSPSTSNALGDQYLDQWKSRVPLKRLASIDEIVSSIIFILSNDYFNGRTLAVDGGLVL
ncbi:SDR family oxidoreductase [Prochlorococcus marinus]|uniref:SDR family oxidoreductase n=1 Tax=Prochlorococcus marinus TaxID=1219 RepID=UPI0018C86091|nr:SDR family oxidoreductase [Prochlorococcus marinus]